MVFFFITNLLKKDLTLDIVTMYRAPTTVAVPPLRGSGVRKYKAKRQVKRKNCKTHYSRER